MLECGRVGGGGGGTILEDVGEEKLRDGGLVAASEREREGLVERAVILDRSQKNI